MKPMIQLTLLLTLAFLFTSQHSWTLAPTSTTDQIITFSTTTSPQTNFIYDPNTSTIIAQSQDHNEAPTEIKNWKIFDQEIEVTDKKKQRDTIKALFKTQPAGPVVYNSKDQSLVIGQVIAKGGMTEEDMFITSWTIRNQQTPLATIRNNNGITPNPGFKDAITALADKILKIDSKKIEFSRLNGLYTIQKIDFIGSQEAKITFQIKSIATSESKDHAIQIKESNNKPLTKEGVRNFFTHYIKDKLDTYIRSLKEEDSRKSSSDIPFPSPHSIPQSPENEDRRRLINEYTGSEEENYMLRYSLFPQQAPLLTQQPTSSNERPTQWTLTIDKTSYKYPVAPHTSATRTAPPMLYNHQNTIYTTPSFHQANFSDSTRALHLNVEAIQIYLQKNYPRISRHNLEVFSYVKMRLVASDSDFQTFLNEATAYLSGQSPTLLAFLEQLNSVEIVECLEPIIQKGSPSTFLEDLRQLDHTEAKELSKTITEDKIRLMLQAA